MSPSTATDTAPDTALDTAPTVGFDLDMTLVDTSAAMAVALRAVARELQVDIDVEACVRASGEPLREHLVRWVPAERMPEAMTVLAEAFVREGVLKARALPGARALLSRIRKGGGRVVVVTTRRERIAQVCLRRAGLSADAVVGGLDPAEKAEALRGSGAGWYVGDHPLDMAAAVSAGIPGIGVATGFHTEDALSAAGATFVLPNLATDAAEAGGAASAAANPAPAWPWEQ